MVHIYDKGLNLRPLNMNHLTLMKKSNQTLVVFNPKKTVQKKLARKNRLSPSNQLTLVRQNVPVQYSINTKQGQPKMTGKNGVINISHTEYIMDVVTSNGGTGGFNGYTCAKLNINAGLSAVFPWLSTVARNFVNYKFKKLNFIFRPMSSTTVPGLIMMVSDPDPSVGLIESKKDFLNRKGATTGNPYRVFKYSPIAGDVNKEKSYYVRSTNVPVGSDIKLLDCAAYFCAYQGTPTNTLIGQFHVEYEVELSVPVLSLSTNLLDNIESFTASSTGTVGASYPLGADFDITGIVGKFVSAGFSYLKGTSEGHLFTTDKTVSKLVEAGGNIGNALVSAGSAVLVNLFAKNESTESDDNLIEFKDESSDVLSLYNSSPSSFTDVTSTYIDPLFVAYTIGLSTSYPPNSYSIRTHFHKIPPGTVVKISGNTSGNNIPVSSGYFRMTDYMPENNSLL